MKNYKNIIFLLADIFIVVGSFFFAIFVRDGFIFTTSNFLDGLREIPFIILPTILIFHLMGMYKGIWKFASIEEVLRGVIANMIAINLAYVIQVSLKIFHFNYNVYFIAFFLITSATVGMRLSYRLYKFYTEYKDSIFAKKRTLIVGAGQAGIMLFAEIRNNREFDKKVIGFIDDNIDLTGKTVHGVPVLGQTKNIVEISKKYQIDTIFLAIPSLDFVETKNMLNLLTKADAQVKLLPPLYEIIGQKQDLSKTRNVKIEDLLGRDPIILEEDGIKDYLEAKTIVVTGGGGSIGSELCRQLRHFNPAKIIIIDVYENNAYDLQMEFKRLYRDSNVRYKPEIIVLIGSVRDENRIDNIFQTYKPDVVFHAAAHKHVPLMEVSPKEAIKNNIFGTYNVAKMADKHKASKFVLISTDKAVNPTNVMGASKRFAEHIIMKWNEKSETDYAAVRFGNVLGSNGSVIPLFQKQIEDGGPVTVTHPDIIRYFMTIPEASQLVIQAGAYAKGGELFVLDMGKQVKILDLAEKLIRLSGFEPYKDINILYTGLRPGEKMYEELLVDYTKASKTNNNKIFVVPNSSDLDGDIDEKMKSIELALETSTNGTAVKLLKSFILSYKGTDS